ncbi:protease do-like mitochondrial-like protein [Chrysochromulina tobinii]|uniref:Protease do-like mitochondrial-like protein n=1 Tax=Chrysochromulina tobinii TaxID=1460289 RepID=A0A0M0J822_9EUKA|nr:protease do-like mitochondrial-like protein [Chrysochromulina tobinii]|eukprot:KOO22744.1 protease do-like mitochondrial-like protein [Chrysochromulina sp. CCMP291]
MHAMTFAALFALASAAAPPWDAVVRIEVAAVAPSYMRPWEKAAQQRQGGTGFLVDGRRILTNHHVIENAVDIRLSKTGNSKRWRARVVAMGPDVDLAALEVIENADEFFADLTPVAWSYELPPLQSRVTVRGYPLGGNAQSVTEGVVSRVDCKNYRLGATSSISPGRSLVVQIDAAINGGNSGGPAFDASNRVIGVAFQGIDGAQSIGYIIPALLARTFLTAVVSAPKFRLADVPFRIQHLENRGLRRYLQVPDRVTGVVVSAPNDVITHLDGVSVGDDGTVPLRPGERVSLDYLITSKVHDAPTELSILRYGRSLTLRAQLVPLPPPLPRWHDFDCTPEWVIIGGLVFSPLTAPLIEDASSGGVRSYVHDIFTREVGAKNGFNTEPAREVVVLLDVLNGGDVNHGYEAEGWKVLTHLNGQAVESLAGLYFLWQQATRDGAAFLEFGFGGGTERKIVLEQAAPG